MRELSPEPSSSSTMLSRRLLGPPARSGQGTVEYVGLILLVALLMVGMVAAMKGFQGKQGLELAQTIVDKIREAVGRVELQVARGAPRPWRRRAWARAFGGKTGAHARQPQL